MANISTLSVWKKSARFPLRSFFVSTLLCFGAPSAMSKTLIFESNTSSSQSTQANAATNSAVSTATASTSVSTADLRAQSNNNAASELYFMVEQLKREVLELRGLVEEQSYRLQMLEEGSKRRYQDLDQRVLELSKGMPSRAAPAEPLNGSRTGGASSEATIPADAPVIVPVSVASEAVDEPSEEQKRAYASAYELVKQRQFDAAIDALHRYIEAYPEGDLSGNAYYWLGEVYLVVPKLEQAKQAFLIVVQDFAGHRKVSDALFKLAVTYDRMQAPAQSEKYLERVQREFPNSTAAKLAKNYKINR